ncbi:MAG: phage tail protein [Methanosarcinaceae archaeon]
MVGTAGKSYPFMSFRFRVEIDGITYAQMSEVTGLQAETEVETYEEGGVNDYVHKLPKKTKYPNLVLKRGITELDQMWKWYQDVVIGIFKRKKGSIILMDSTGSDRWRWNFIDAYPVKWKGPELRADSNTVAFETVELVHNGIKKG